MIINKTLQAIRVIQVFTNLIILITLASAFLRTPDITISSCQMFYTFRDITIRDISCTSQARFFTLISTLIIVPFWSYFLPSNLHQHSPKLCFDSVSDSFIPVTILNIFRFMSLILLGTYVL